MPKLETAESVTPGRATLVALERVFRGGSFNVKRSCKSKVDKAAKIVATAALGSKPIYGVNTGFGKLASVRIAPEDTAQLQRNLILSHCAGVGDPTEPDVVRLMMALKVNSLARGASGVRFELIERLEEMLTHGILPVVPAQGSVGASGDLAPLAHMSAVLIGAGSASLEGKAMAGAAAMKRAKLQPLTLQAKEGLALINGTQFSTAYALAGLYEAWRNAQAAIVISALSTDAIMGSTDPLRAELHELRGHKGQTVVAKAMRALLAGSVIRESHLEGDTRVQDPYCIRCQPQVTGAAFDLLWQTAKTLEIEANAVTDNPLVLVETGDIVSGGNFHAEPVAFAADQIALAIAEIGAIAQRRVALMVDPVLSFDLPPFLARDPGLNSGFMIAEVTTAALMSENKHLANPCSTDSTPTSANQEDHVSMAAHGARRLRRMNANLRRILAVELLCAARGVEFRAPLKTSEPLARVIKFLRQHIPTLDRDRELGADIELAARMIEDGSLVAAAGVMLPSMEMKP